VPFIVKNEELRISRIDFSISKSRKPLFVFGRVHKYQRVYVIHVTRYMLEVTCYKLYVATYMLHVICWKSHATSYMSQLICYTLYVTSAFHVDMSGSVIYVVSRDIPQTRA